MKDKQGVNRRVSNTQTVINSINIIKLIRVQKIFTKLLTLISTAKT